MNSQIETLRAMYGSVEKIDPASKTYKELCALLDRAPTAHLRLLADANIKFVSLLAQNRVRARVSSGTR